MKRLLVFASGDKDGGGSGFQELVRATRTTPAILDANIVAVVSNHEHGGVRQKADALGVPFVHFEPSFSDVASYHGLVRDYHPHLVALSGWVWKVCGLDPRRVENIHPALLPEFGGDGMYGHHVHEAVMAAYHDGKVTQSGVSMHFATEIYDEGPVFFRFPVLIDPKDTPETLKARVNKVEHCWQAWVTNLVLHGEISWNGDKACLPEVPDWYRTMPFCPEELKSN